MGFGGSDNEVLVAQSIKYRMQEIAIPRWASLLLLIRNTERAVGPVGLKNSRTVWCMT